MAPTQMVSANVRPNDYQRHVDRCVVQGDRPVGFVEVLLGADEAGLTALLNQCRYVDCVLHPEGATPPGRDVRHDTLAWNHIWMPEESVGLL